MRVKGRIITAIIVCTCMLVVAVRVIYSPASRTYFFTEKRAKDMSQFAEDLLNIPGVSKISVVRGPRTDIFGRRVYRWNLDSTLDFPDHKKEQIVAKLKRHRLHGLWVKRDTKTVMFGYFFIRSWYSYSYTKDGYLYKPLGQPHIIEQLDNNWIFSVE